MSTGLSVDSQLLLLCARGHIDAITKERIGDLASQDLNWARFCRIVTRHRVPSMAYHALMQSCPEAIPTPRLEDLRGKAEAIATKNEKILSVMLEALSLFEGKDIPVVPFKGVPFALFVYGNLKLRQMSDVDMLVRPADFHRAGELLIRAGFRRGYFGHAEVATVQTPYWRDGIYIDLHYGITPLYQHCNMEQARNGGSFTDAQRNKLDRDSTYWHFWLDCEPLWDRLNTLTIGERSVPVFAPEDTLLISVIHGIKENWRLLHRISDLADLVRAHPNMNWEQILERVNTLGCKRKFLLGLLLAQQLCEMPLPKEVLNKIPISPTLISLTNQTRHRVCKNGLSRDYEEFRLLCALFTMDRFTDRVRYIFYVIRRLRQLSYNRSQWLKFYKTFSAQLAVCFRSFIPFTKNT